MTSETKAPSAKQIDKMIKEYATMQTAILAQKAVVATLQEQSDGRKQELLDLIEKHGFSHTEKSKRIKGVHHMATATTATLVQVDDEACDKFRTFLTEKVDPKLTDRFFSQRVTYQLVGGPGEVLRSLELPARIRVKMMALVQACVRVTTKDPSLKVDVAELQKV